jgi:protein-disulfide isomerase
MNRNIIVAAAFFGIVIVVIAGFSSYYFSLLEAQNMPMIKPTSMINLENGSPALGSESAPITIVEFGDYQCESCYYWFHNTRSTLIDNRKGKTSFCRSAILGA